MMLGKIIQNEERLYRAIKRSKPDCIKNGKVTSALYKYEKCGISVDRDGGRELGAIIVFLQKGALSPRVKGIAEISARECYNAGTEIIAAESLDNPYHANIFTDKENEQRQNIQALQLADASRIVFMDENMEWI